MNEVNIVDGIVPLSEFRSKMADIERARVNREPLVLTQHGKSVAVVLSPREYELLAERDRFIAAVNEGLKDVEEGRVIDDKDFEEEMTKRREVRRKPKGKAS